MLISRTGTVVTSGIEPDNLSAVSSRKKLQVKSQTSGSSLPFNSLWGSLKLQQTCGDFFILCISLSFAVSGRPDGAADWVLVIRSKGEGRI